jgi:hypothetical protein
MCRMSSVRVAVCSLMLLLSSVRAFAPSTLHTSSRTKAIAASKTALRMVSILDLLGGAGGAKNQLIDPQKALPGRPQKMAGIDGLKHYVLRNPLTEVPDGYKEAIFANGCFWGTEKSFWRLPQGTLLFFVCGEKKRIVWCVVALSCSHVY